VLIPGKFHVAVFVFAKFTKSKFAYDADGRLPENQQLAKWNSVDF
jgi:cbb3-type cytochrome oxidase subunit 3